MYFQPDTHAQKSTTWLRQKLVCDFASSEPLTPPLRLVWNELNFTLEIVRRKASKIWTRYSDGSYSTLHASVHEKETWNYILRAWSSSHCHLWKVAYFRCSFLVLSASSRLYWKRSTLVVSGLRDYEQSVMPTNCLYLRSVIVIKRTEFDRWPHVISTSILQLQKWETSGKALHGNKLEASMHLAVHRM